MGGGWDENLNEQSSAHNNIDTIYLKLKVKATEFLLRDLMCEFEYYTFSRQATVRFKQSKYMWLICFKQCFTCARSVQHIYYKMKLSVFLYVCLYVPKYLEKYRTFSVKQTPKIR